MDFQAKMAIQRIADLLHSTGHQDVMLLPLLLFLSKGHESIPPYNWRHWAHRLDYGSLREKLRSDITDIFSSMAAGSVSYQLVSTLEYIDSNVLQKLIDVLAHSQDNLQRLTPEDFLESVVKQGKSPKQVDYFSSPFVADQVGRLVFESLTKSTPTISVLDLGAGVGILTAALQSRVKQEGWRYSLIDINRQIALIGQMYLLLSGLKKEQIKYIVGDALMADWHQASHYDIFRNLAQPINSLDNSELFDIILSHPPVGHNNSFFRVTSTSSSRLEIQFIHKALELLKPYGVAVLIVPDSFLTQQESQSFTLRKLLIDQDFISHVISLPEDSIAGAGIRFSILVVNKSKQSSKRRSIRFQVIVSEKEFIDRTPNLFSSLSDDEIDSKDISIDEVIFNGYNLSSRRYLLQKPLNTGDYVQLAEVAEVLAFRIPPTQKANKSKGFPFLTTRQLGKNAESFQITSSNIDQYVDDRLNSNRMIQRDDVVVSAIGQRLRASLYSLDMPAFAGNGILFIRPNRNRLIPEYLVAQLWSDYTQKQVNAFSTGMTLSKYDLEQIQVEIKPIRRQREWLNKFLATTLQESQVAYKTSLQDDIVATAGRLQHSVGNSLETIRLDLQYLLKFSQQQGFNPLTKPNARPEVAEKSRLSTVLQRLLDETEHGNNSIILSREWVRVSKGMINGETHALKQFLSKQLEHGTWSDYCSVEVIGDETNITFDSDLMVILLRNFLVNAVKHGGFRDRNKTENIVQIEISRQAIDSESDQLVTGQEEQQTVVTIYIRNNGKSLPLGFTVKDFTAEGNRNGSSGYGGSMIATILQAHNGTLSIIPPESVEFSSFPVQFKIELPIQ